MADYIRREDALKALYNDYAYAAMDVIKRVPAADVAEVVHGQWIKDDFLSDTVVHAKWIPFHSEAAGDIQYCSACEIGFDARMDYCPHCGARMDGWMEGTDNE